MTGIGYTELFVAWVIYELLELETATNKRYRNT